MSQLVLCLQPKFLKTVEFRTLQGGANYSATPRFAEILVLLTSHIFSFQTHLQIFTLLYLSLSLMETDTLLTMAFYVITSHLLPSKLFAHQEVSSLFLFHLSLPSYSKGSYFHSLLLFLMEMLYFWILWHPTFQRLFLELYCPPLFLLWITHMALFFHTLYVGNYLRATALLLEIKLELFV